MIRPTLLLRAVFLSLSFFGCSTFKQATPLIIPFESSEGDTDILIPAIINGKTRIRVALDTGAGIEVLGTKLAQAHDLRVHETHTGRRLNQDPLTVEMGPLKSLTVGNITRTNWMAAPHPYFDEISKKLNIQGLVSLKFFEDQPFTIDYPKRKVILETSASLRERKKSGILIKLTKDSQFPRALDAYVNLKVDGKFLIKAIVDTGSAPTKLPLNMFEKMNLNKQDPRVRHKNFQTIAGTKADALFLPAPSRVQLSPSIKNDTTEIRFEENLRAASIGGNFFRNFAVTFDLKNSELILFPKAHD